MPLDRTKLSAATNAMLDKVMSFGISEQDAEVITDSIISHKSCSWVNNDNVEESTIKALNEYLTQNNVPIVVYVSPVSSRNKFVWEIKIRR
jgi:ribosome biogenesis protein Tsr3